ncbi:MAG: transposase [Nitrososphaerales archaeon]|nr:transposase [Nitrososphaerales archaeon]
MQVNRGYRTELKPNKNQVIGFKKARGAARTAYNWGLERNNNVRLFNQLPHLPIRYESPIDQHRLLNERKRRDWAWMYEVSKCAPQEALRDLGNAFHNFLKRPDHFGWPRFKSKHDDVQSFTLTGAIHIKKDSIQLPTFGEVRLKECGYLPVGHRVQSATVSSRAGRWFISIGVRKRIKVPENCGPVVGVDFGIKHLTALSDGTIIENGHPLGRTERRLERLQRSLSRKQKGSANRWKAKLRLQRLHMRISDARKDGLHKLTTMLTRTKSVVVVEDLAVQNMTKRHSLAKAILDGAPGEMRRQLEYKARWYGSRLVVAPRNFPSTKMCSRCHRVKEEMPLSERIYECERCGLVIDRDLNAAKNLEWWYDHPTVAGSSPETLNACLRQEVAGPQGPVPVVDAGSVWRMS